MKKLILSLIFVVLLAGVACAGSPIQGVIASKRCTGANDTHIYDVGNVPDTTTNADNWRGMKFTLASVKVVTGAFISVHDNDTSQNVTCYVYTDNGDPSTPLALYHEDMEGTYTNVPNTGWDEIDILFDSPHVLPAGTYWQVCVTGDTTVGYGHELAGTGTYMWSADGLEWNASTNEINMGILGCN